MFVEMGCLSVFGVVYNSVFVVRCWFVDCSVSFWCALSAVRCSLFIVGCCVLCVGVA